ncbi:MAG: hypothetical protein QNK24_10905 [Desulfuromusa sp.]|nr:hypothetical protein [Desulfuromusa sp.]
MYTGRFNQRLAEAYAAAGETELARRHAQIALEIYDDLDDINRDWITAAEQILRR